MIKKTVILGNLVALSMILFLLEGLIPIPFIAPGAKLGLSQVVIVFTLYFFSFKDAALVLVSRTLLSSLLFGGPTVFFYSVAGGALSLIVMLLLKKSNIFTIFSVSAAGGFCHNLGQLTVAYLLTESKSFFYYASVLCPIGIVTGLIIGYVANILLQRVKLSRFSN